MSFEERDEWVTIEVDRFVQKSGGAVLIKVEGSEYWVGNGAIDNLNDILTHLARPTSNSAKVDEIVVPKWLAIDNGWMDEDD